MKQLTAEPINEIVFMWIQRHLQIMMDLEDIQTENYDKAVTENYQAGRLSDLRSVGGSSESRDIRALFSR